MVMMHNRQGLAVQLAVLALVLIWASPVRAQDASRLPAEKAADPVTAPQPDGPINFEADTVEYDSESEIVTASGNVVLVRGNDRVEAQSVVWNRNTGEVLATGNVRARGRNGELAYGESIVLTDTLRDGVVQNLLIVLNEGQRLAAARGVRSGDIYTLENAAYSPCAVQTTAGCPKEPTWQILADRVVYDAAAQKIRYKGARLSVFGLPLLPLPGLSQAVGQEYVSGLLTPDIRFSRNNGVEYTQPYYIRLSPNRDLTLTGHVYTDVAPMLGANYRALTELGAYQVTGYVTTSGRASANDPAPLSLNGELRGYLESSGRFQFDPNWSLSHSFRVASDRTFLRRYDISNDDRLRSTFAAERIDEKSYFAVTGWAVQTLRAGDVQGQVPVALPEIDYRRRIREPLLGGIAKLQLNSLAVGRRAGQDTQRAFASLRWDLRKLTDWGQQIEFTLMGRGDVYHSDENLLNPIPVYRGRPGWQSRGIFAAAVDVQWPFVGALFGGTHTLTPRVQIVASPTSGNLTLPNEDARSIELEDSNLFALNRFPGYDRFEDNYRVTVGVDWALRTDTFTIDANFGQSVRLDKRESIFPDGTGLSERVSDFVGRTEVRYKNLFGLTHRFRLDKDNLAIRRNEIDATFGTRGTYLKVGYLKLNRDIGPTVEDLRDREELRLGGRITVRKHVSVFGSTIIDLTSAREEPASLGDGYEPIRHRLGISYDDECLSLGLTWRRDYDRTGDDRRGNTFLFRLAFRQLGV